MINLKTFVKNKFENFSTEKMGFVFSNAWIKIFPIVFILMIISALLIILNIGHNKVYKSDLSDEELATKVLLERKKNKFQKDKFDNILKSVKERKIESVKNIEKVDNIFYTSDILERMSEFDNKNK